MTNAISNGYCDSRYQTVRQEFDRRLNSGEDFGASIAVIEKGELIVDLWGGFTDKSQTHQWQADTLVNTWSVTKTMTALAALLLIDRGQLDPNASVAQYWPEFAQAGKDAVLVSHVLSHSSGVAAWDAELDMEAICDIRASNALLAAQAPWWPPGTVSGYHVLSFGHLVDELVWRITGQSLADFFRSEIARPLNADFHISLAESEHHRVAEMIPAPPPTMPEPGSIAFRAFTQPIPNASFVNTATWRSAGVGGAGGQGNARSMAEIQSILSHGGVVKGQRFLRQATIDLALERQIHGIDLVLGQAIHYGLGYGLAEFGEVPFIPNRRIAFWGGAGGSLIINDLERQTTFAYAMNRMEPNTLMGNPNSIAYYRLFDDAQAASY